MSNVTTGSKRVRFNDGKDNPIAKISKPGNNQPKKFKLKNNQERTLGSHPGARFKENHSLDSDSDDDEEKKKVTKQDYEKLTEEDVEGAEDDVYDEDGEGEKITPFNLREEMEEGDFDKDGNYHYKKDREIRDNWLDNIDWVDVKKVKKMQEKLTANEMETEEDPYNELEVLKGIVDLMEVGETVTKAIRRLGNNNKGGKNKGGRLRLWQKKKVYDLDATDNAAETSSLSATEKETKDKEDLLKLTGLVDRVAGAGYYDIYTDAYEKLQHKVKTLEAMQPVIPEDEDDALEMFGSNIDKEEAVASHEDAGDGEKEPSIKEATMTEDEEVKWIYKWKAEDTETHGPFTSQEMQEWKDEGFFKDDVYVQRTDRPGVQFYSSRRIDFDLYS